MRKRRQMQEFSLSFLDVICCGFGAIILLLMITKIVEPIVLEQSVIDLDGQVIKQRESLHEIRGQATQLERQLTRQQAQLQEELQRLAKVKSELSNILGQFAASEEQAELQMKASKELAAAKQSLTREMEELLGAGFARADATIGGITVDSEWIIFVIDTSGSMFNFAWPLVIQKVRETLNIYPTVKGIQVMNDMGDYMFSGFAGQWMTDSPAMRRSISQRLANWNPFSNSSPVEGIERAISTFYDPNKRISIYVFGDDFSGRSVEEVVDTVDRINKQDADGNRLVRIHAVGFPVLFQAAPGQQASVYRFAHLMRELTYRNNGTFVALPTIK